MKATNFPASLCHVLYHAPKQHKVAEASQMHLAPTRIVRVKHIAKMSKSQLLRVLVNKRLNAVAEEIFALFDRMIAEYEEELCRSKEENQRKQELLDTVLGPRVVLLKAGLQTTSVSLGADLNQDINQTLQMMKEEPVPVSIPELHSSAIVVRSQESPQTDHTEEARGEEEGINLEPRSQPETQPEHSCDNEECWGAPLSDAEVESDVTDGDQYNQLQIWDKIIAAQNSDAGMRATVNDRAKSKQTQGDGLRKHQCFMCDKRFRSKQHLQTHIRVHTGERPYSCSVCNKRFGDMSTLRGHMRIHTGERPFICSFCEKAFTQSANLHVHVKRMHNGKKLSSVQPARKPLPVGYNSKYILEKSHEWTPPGVLI